MKNKPKVILWDLETLPNADAILDDLPELNSDRYGLTLKAELNSILCFGYKELGSDKVKCVSVWDTPRGKKDLSDDLDLLKIAYNVLSEADAIVTHNGTNFDLKMLNTRLTMAGLPPLPKIQHIDTCQVSKHQLYFLRNRLDHLAQKLSTARKLKHDGWSMWARIAKSRYKPNNRAIAKDKRDMVKYNKKDVIVLEQIFNKLRPYINNLPNHNIFSKDGAACPTCGSYNLIRNGTRTTKTASYTRYRCNDCGTSSFNKLKKKMRLETL